MTEKFVGGGAAPLYEVFGEQKYQPGDRPLFI
jgi:hypothetical protein